MSRQVGPLSDVVIGSVAGVELGADGPLHQ